MVAVSRDRGAVARRQLAGAAEAVRPAAELGDAARRGVPHAHTVAVARRPDDDEGDAAAVGCECAHRSDRRDPLWRGRRGRGRGREDEQEEGASGQNSAHAIHASRGSLRSDGPQVGEP